MAFITNNSGGSSGNQKLGTRVITNGGIRPIAYNPLNVTATGAAHNGDFDGNNLIALSSVSGKYDNRYDDVGYYE